MHYFHELFLMRKLYVMLHDKPKKNLPFQGVYQISSFKLNIQFQIKSIGTGTSSSLTKKIFFGGGGHFRGRGITWKVQDQS